MANIINIDGETIDFAAAALEDVLAVLDTCLDALEVQGKAVCDPDAFGILDEVDYLAGFGFVACQGYLTRVRRSMPKDLALASGPKRGAKTLAEVVNAAADLWKHSAEWPDRRMGRTVEVLKAVDIDPNGDYPAWETLNCLRGDLPKRFRPLLPGFVAWRDAVLAEQRRGRTG